MSYPAWLAIVSAAVFLAERLRPARPRQATLRPQFAGDLGWLIFNGWLWSFLTGSVVGRFAGTTRELFSSLGLVSETGWLEARPFWLQFVVLLTAADFLQWCVHNLLHRVPLLWQFHKLHHSIRTMDWLGNFRFHWMEAVVYRSLLFVPLGLWLGPSAEALTLVAILTTLWGHLNHANVDLDLGPLGYLLNSPRMHLWHHDASSEGGTAKNFAIVFSAWDWLFGTAYWPRDRAPAHLGYPRDEEMPARLSMQLFFPLTRRKSP
jgi:sterol desaturase/sphingolipid hydroxylase (fatty acid hydroxylase superfamily)